MENTHYVARDKDGTIHLFINNKPDLIYNVYPNNNPTEFNNYNTEWFSTNDWGAIMLPFEMFPEITFDNSPIEVTINIKK